MDVDRAAGWMPLGTGHAATESSASPVDDPGSVLGQALTRLTTPAPRRSEPVSSPDGWVEASRVPGPVDWRLVTALRREASERISEERAAHRDRTGSDLAEADLRMLGRAVVRRVVGDHAARLANEGQALWSVETEEAHVRAVLDAIFGYGRMQPLFEIPDAENIEINGCDRVFVQYGDGRREERPPVADSDEELVEAVRFLGESATPPRPFDDAHPTMTVALGDQYRLHAIGFGLSHRPSIVVRHHTLTRVCLDDLVATGMMPRQVAVLLRAAVLARRSIVIAGDQGAGKTTLLRALVDAIPPTERFGTLETDYELLTHLNPGRPNMVALQATVGLGERVDGRTVGEFTVADLVPEALRQNLSRLVVGEVRGAEAGAMFEAMQAGAGTMSTTHSHSATSTMDRLAARVALGGVMTIEEAYRQIAHNITFLVHVTLVDDTWRGGTRSRHVTEIRQLTGATEGGRPVTHLTYRAAGPAGPAAFHPDPTLVAELAHYEPEVARWV